MLKYLKLQNVGPAAEMELELGSRLNILTGDNGLGKSFLLDVAWYFEGDGSWPAEVNPRLITGKSILPQKGKKPLITYKKVDQSKEVEYHAEFDFASLNWSSHVKNHKYEDDIQDSKISIYWMADGSCAVHDRYRYDNAKAERRYRSKGDVMFPFVFDPVQVWDGLISSDGRIVCNGLIRDVASWQKENGPSFENLKATLLHLSPNSREPITFGPSTRISVDEVRDIPTVSTGYGEPVAILHASSGIKRIFAMAYMLVWAWEEHKRAAEFRQTAPFKDMLLLIDELESHLHPSWQRQILPALLTVTNTLSQEIKIQLIATTHSPLIMASLEPIFDAETDAWFDLDLVGENGHREVKLEKREFEIRGDANKWLMSKAFDLNSSRSEEAEEVLARAANALEKDTFDREEIEEIQAQMNKYLPPSDVFFIKWDMLGKKKGWWE